MVVRLRLLFLLLVTISSTAVNAELAIDSDDKKGKSEHKLTNVTLIMNEYSYEIQQDTSTIAFRVDSPVGEVWASFEDFKGSFAMFGGEMHSDSTIVDINADSLDSDTGFVSTMLKSESFFDVENFPSVRFVGSSFEWFSETRAVLKGEMTIQNVTRPVAFYVELVDADADNKYSERITVKATTTIKRSKFGIYTLLPVVSDDVNLYLSIDGVKLDTATTMVSELQH